MVRRKPGKKKTSYARRRQIAGLALIAGVLLLGVVLFASLGGNDDEIAGGVSIGSVDVGGMTRAEAEKTVQDDASATFEKISFGTGEDGFSVSGEDLGVEVNAAQAVDEAYAVGRRGGVFQHISDAARSRLGGVQVALVAGYDEGKAKAALAKAADGYNQEPQNASFDVTDDGKVEVEEARERAGPGPGRHARQPGRVAEEHERQRPHRPGCSLPSPTSPRPRSRVTSLRR